MSKNVPNCLFIVLAKCSPVCLVKFPHILSSFLHHIITHDIKLPFSLLGLGPSPVQMLTDSSMFWFKTKRYLELGIILSNLTTISSSTLWNISADHDSTTSIIYYDVVLFFILCCFFSQPYLLEMCSKIWSVVLSFRTMAHLPEGFGRLDPGRCIFYLQPNV